MPNHMTLIKETTLDPTNFLARQKFWVGESSKKIQVLPNCRAKEGVEEGNRRLLRTVFHSVCKSLSDENIQNCNKLFWSKKCFSGGSEYVRI